MVELVETIAKALVDDPDAVEVTEISETQTIQLRVAPDDMGRVIGKQGRIAKAIRVVVKAMATRAGTKVTVEIVE